VRHQLGQGWATITLSMRVGIMAEFEPTWLLDIMTDQLFAAFFE
jgi:hypothetical protein